MSYRYTKSCGKYWVGESEKDLICMTLNKENAIKVADALNAVNRKSKSNSFPSCAYPKGCGNRKGICLLYEPCKKYIHFK